MRKILMMAAVLMSAQGAQAADMPSLRGGYTDLPTRPMWEGFYIGGQAGQAWMKTITPAGYNADVAGAYGVRTGIVPIAFGALPRVDVNKGAFGGFFGYNSQFEDVLIGIEANYLHSSIAANSVAFTGPASPVRALSSVNLAMKDFGSLRLRGGYMIGSFLPYAFAGAAAGSTQITQTVGATSNAGVPVTAPFEVARKDRFVYGYSAGVGLDVLLIGGLFARVEYEYMRFTSKIDTTVNTVRAGIGYKF